MPEFATKEQFDSIAAQTSNLIIQNMVNSHVISALLATHQYPQAVIELLEKTTPHIENPLLFSPGVSDDHISMFRDLLNDRLDELRQYSGKR